MDYSFTYLSTTLDQLPDAEQQLCAKALEASEGSYAPYSNYHVGAAIKLSDGTVVTGANQENASYPCGTCAERTALNYAQSAYPTLTVAAIAVAAKSSSRPATKLPFPCGLCRQALLEAEQRQNTPIKIIVATSKEAMVFPSAACLLPFAF